MQLGIQLWQVLCENEPDEALFQRLYEYGYNYVEPCIIFGDPVKEMPSFWTPSMFEEMLPMIRKANLGVRSCHIFLPKGRDDYQAVVDFAVQFKIPSLVVKCPQTISLEEFSQAAKDYSELAKLLDKVSTSLLLHPEGSDTSAALEGTSAFEWMLDHCHDLKIQCDVGWMYYGGIDLYSFFEKYRKRIVSIHYKDVKGIASAFPEANRAVCSVGKGVVPLFDAFAFTREMEIPQLIDSDKLDISNDEEIRQAAELIHSFSSRRVPEQSLLETYDTETGERKVLHVFDRIIEAPNWLKDGDTILYNSDGKLYSYSVSRDDEKLVDTGICQNLNNDHVPSPDNKWVGVSSMTFGDNIFSSHVYAVSLEGKEPIRMTEGDIDWLHGWSHEGDEISWCAFKPAEHPQKAPRIDGSNGGIDVDLYSKKLPDGKEIRLTDGKGYSDGPEYDPDGRTIWFNSTRDGLMQIYRIGRDGKGLTRVVSSDRNDWFPHVSPDGRKVVFISYGEGAILPAEHIPGMNVKLFLMNPDGTDVHEIVSLYGGQGTINVNSWAPDSRRFAFVSYRKMR